MTVLASRGAHLPYATRSVVALIGEKTALGDIVAAHWPVLVVSFVVSLLVTPL